MINRSNYEQFFLDFYDGTLNAAQKKELFAFLDANADLKAEFENFEKISVEPAGKVYFDKERLKKNTVTIYNYKTYFTAWLEKDLNDEEVAELNVFLEKNPGLKQELEIVKQTKLFPDYSIKFENKGALKKGGKVIALNPWVYRTAAIAASLALIFVFTYVINKKGTNTEVAVTKNEKTEQTTPAVKQLADVKEEKTSVEVKEKKNVVTPLKRIVTPEVKNVLADKSSNEKEAMPVTDERAKENMLPVKVVISKEDEVASINVDSLKKNYQVFTDEELAELGMAETPVKEQSALNKAAGSLGKKLFGESVKIENRKNEKDSTQTFALALGQFEFSRTTSR
jgi:hypothetical protein